MTAVSNILIRAKTQTEEKHEFGSFARRRGEETNWYLPSDVALEILQIRSCCTREVDVELVLTDKRGDELQTGDIYPSGMKPKN